MFDTSNPRKCKAIASMPIEEIGDGSEWSDFASTFCYDESRDIVRIASNIVRIGSIQNYKEMKLYQEVLASGFLTSIPSFVKIKQLDASLGMINIMHMPPQTNLIFLLCEQGYWVLTTSKYGFSTEHLSEEQRPYTELYEGADGCFRGFQPSLRPNKYLLLMNNCVIPIYFTDIGGATGWI